jgi:ABC-type oligopeptide transport system substrate-binding subunit
MDPPSWNQFVTVKHAQDQMAARNQASVGLNYQPFVQLGKFRTGGGSNVASVSDPVFDAFLPTAQAATTLDAVKQVMVSANQYVAQQHFVIVLPTPSSFSFYQPWLNGYNGQASIFSGNYGLLGFNGARFWIDK